MNENKSSFKKTTKQTATERFLIAAALSAIAALLVRQFNSPDVWWQIAIGRDILSSMAVPHIDHFSAAGWGRNYHDSHWLFQVLLATIDRFGGLKAVGIVPITTWIIIFFCSYRSFRSRLPPTEACLLLFVVAVACNYRFTPRPEIVTSLMIAFYYLKLQSDRYTSMADLTIFFILQVIWSNSHGLFVIGPFMAGCYLVDAAWKKIRYKPSALLPSARLLAILLLASLCTPFGIQGWRYAVQIAQEAGPTAHMTYRTLEELRPTFSRGMLLNPDFWGFFLLLAAGLGAVISLTVKQQLPVSRMLIVVAMLAAATTGRRNIPLFALTVAPFIAEACRHSLLQLLGQSNRYRTVIAIGLCAFIWLPLSGRYYQLFGYEPLRFGIGAPAGSQPLGLPEFLRQSGFSGQIYNNDLFGGFCLYHGIRPLLDGRWEVYDQDELSMILQAPFSQAAWEWVVARYGITGALVHNGAAETRALVTRLITDGSFRLVYQDRISSFWIRSTP